MSTGHIRILSVDDHQLIREGLAALINDEPDMTLVAEATDGGKAIRAFRAHRPDVTLMDLRLPDMSGIDALVAIARSSPRRGSSCSPRSKATPRSRARSRRGRPAIS